jgi:segregation and condensation protein B
MAEARAVRSGGNVTSLSPDHHRLHLRMLEAILFAASAPLATDEIAARMPEGIEVPALLLELQTAYAGRGVNLHARDGAWAFRTAEDLSFVLRRDVIEHRKLSRAALETLAIIAYHQPVTRAEIEDIRGVAVAKGTLDLLLEAQWVRLRGRRRAPGRPVTFGTTPEFLDHFGLTCIDDLPGLGDLKAAGLLDERDPSDDEAALLDGRFDGEEDRLEDNDEQGSGTSDLNDIAAAYAHDE